MNWPRIRRYTARTVAILLLAAFAGSWLVGSRLVAPASHTVGLPPSDLPAETHSIPSKSGSSLAAWYIPVERATATVVLLHPVRGDRRSMLNRARLLHNAGYATLLIDLQAHGESPGQHITMGYLEQHDAAAAVEWARTLNPSHRIGVIGCSLGGAAILLASPQSIDVLVLESVYPTIAEAVHNRVAMRCGPLHYLLAPALTAQLQPRLGITRKDLRPIDYISQANCPVLVAAGNHDHHTTLAETKRMYTAAHLPKQLAIFKGAAHVDLLEHDPQKYRNVVLPFLEAHLQADITKGSPKD